MDEIQDQIDGVEEEAGVVKDLYDLVEQYQVPVNPEDMAVYQVQCTCDKAGTSLAVKWY